MILSSGGRSIAAGLGSGVAIALVGAQVLTRALKGVPVALDPYDPVAFVGVTLVLSITAIVAMFGPALRAASADPVHALRQD